MVLWDLLGCVKEALWAVNLCLKLVELNPMYSILLLLEMTEHLYTTFSVKHFPFSAQSLGFLQLHPFSDRGLLDLVTFLLCPEIV